LGYAREREKISAGDCSAKEVHSRQLTADIEELKKNELIEASCEFEES
jgi:hypothetical protein